MIKRCRIPASVLIGISVALGAFAQTEYVTESPRDIPLAYDVDVVVVGGSSGAVAAAVAAAEQGASVFLAAPRPYLGEDLCATYRLWLEPNEKPVSPLAQTLFAEPKPVATVGPGLPFTYTNDATVSKSGHPDTTPPSLLNDGKWKSAVTDSVQYDGDAVITLDLGKECALGAIQILAFQRRNDIELSTITVSLSNDNVTWQDAAVIENRFLGLDDYIDSSFQLSAPLKGSARYVRLSAKRSPAVKRFLLGEVVIEPQQQVSKPKDNGGYRIPPSPMQIKRVLDQALLDAGVDFLYSCYPTNLLRDSGGNLAGIVMVNRSGRQAIKAKVIIDATERATVARMAGVGFEPYPAGDHVFTRVVLGGTPREGAGISARVMPKPVQTGQQGSPETNAIEYTLTLPMNDASFASFAQAEQIARDMTWDPAQVATSDFLFQIPPDPMKAKTVVNGPWPEADAIDLDVFRPADITRLYVLGGCAGVSREAAEQLLRPLTFLDVGARIGQAAAAEAGVQPKPVVVCFGDSITAGPYPKKLDRMFPECHILNAGVGGNTSEQGLARLDADVLVHKPAAVVILFGTNDSCMTAAKQYQTPVEQYEKNVREMLDRCAAQGAKVVLCTTPPIDDEPYYTRHPKEFYEPEGGLQSVLDRYRAALLAVAESTKTPVVDLHEALALDASAIGPDGVHPSPAGERAIAALVADALRPLFGAGAPAAQGSAICVALNGDGVLVSSGPSEPLGEIREFLNGLRPTQSAQSQIRSEQNRLPVLGQYDVVVVGGGTGGAPAGISAARDGAKTLVLEYLSGLGGVGTLGLIGAYYHGYRGGFTEEIDNEVARMGPPEQAPKEGRWNVEWKMEWFRRELRGNNADIWFGAMGCGALVDQGVLKGVVVATPNGRGVVLAKVVIDSTGNSDIAAAAGADCIYTDGSDVAVQGTGLPPRMPGANYTNTDYTIADDTDIVDTWRMFVTAKGKFENAYDLGQLIDTRERRRIVGDFVISPLDVFYQRTYPDAIGLSTSDFDTHGYTLHPFFAIKAPDKQVVTAYTPYRSLLPKGLNGILVTGLGISAHRDAMPILRMEPDIQNQGYAAGSAAAMAVANGTDIRSIDIKALQARLVDKKCVPANVLTDVDSFPVPLETIQKAVDSLPNALDGVGLLLDRPADALPLLRNAYVAAEFEKDKLVYAHVLAMMGDPSGLDMLLQQVASSPWDEGWDYKGMGQFGSSMSRLDSLIVAVGAAKDKRALPTIIEKVNQLSSDSDFSHHRAVALALESLADPSAAQPLAELLRKPAMMGHVCLDIDDAQRDVMDQDPNEERNRSLRELMLARALYRCGDCDGLGRKILQEYTRDYRGHWARHAYAILNEDAKR